MTENNKITGISDEEIPAFVEGAREAVTVNGKDPARDMIEDLFFGPRETPKTVVDK